MAYIISNELVPSPAPAVFLQAPLFAPTPKAAKRVLEFFATQINNDHTRKAYLNATRRFAQWCEARGIRELAAVEPYHVAAFIKKLRDKDLQEKPMSAPTVKQHLAALRMLFDWLVIGHIIDVNPAHAVRGPKHVVRKGKTSVLTAEEARELLDSIPLERNTGRRRRRDAKTESSKRSIVGLRDRALIATMVYSVLPLRLRSGLRLTRMTDRKTL
jgi:site-specific recombinase XerD